MPSRESLITNLLIALKDIVSVNITKTEEPEIASMTGTYGNFIITMIITIIFYYYYRIIPLATPCILYCMYGIHVRSKTVL